MFVSGESEVPVFCQLYEFLHEACAESANDVVDEEASGAHGLLHDASEHPYGKHVEEEVLPAGVHEHVGEELPGAEVVGHEEVQAEDVVEVDVVCGEGYACKETQHVDDEQVFGYGWYCVHDL